MVSRAPGCRSSRASSAGSTAAPNAPSRCASARSSGMSGSSADRAVERIGAVDRLQLDQRAAAVGGARHRAHGGGGRDLAARLRGSAARRRSASRWISENDRSPPRMTRPSRASPSVRLARNRADAGHRHHAERDAGDEHGEAAQAAAQFAQREAQRAERCGAWAAMVVMRAFGAKLAREEMHRRRTAAAACRSSGRRARRRDAPRSAPRCRSGPRRS